MTKKGRSGPTRTGRRLACLALLCGLSGPLLAAEPEPASRASLRDRLSLRNDVRPKTESRPAVRRSERRFRKELRRVDVPMESLSVFHGTLVPGEQAGDHVMFEELEAAVGRGLKRATRRALKDYLLEAVDVDRVIDRLKQRHRGRRDAAKAARADSGKPSRLGRKRVEFDVGIHSFVPEVEMTYHLQGREVALEANADGEVGLRYSTVGAKYADVGLDWDGDDTFGFSFRFAF